MRDSPSGAEEGVAQGVALSAAEAPLGIRWRAHSQKGLVENVSTRRAAPKKQDPGLETEGGVALAGDAGAADVSQDAARQLLLPCGGGRSLGVAVGAAEHLQKREA